MDFGLVLDRALDTAVAILFADLERSVFPSSNAEEESRVRLAGLLPALQHWSQDALKGLPCVLVDVSLLLELTGIQVDGFVRIYFQRGKWGLWRQLYLLGLRMM